MVKENEKRGPSEGDRRKRTYICPSKSPVKHVVTLVKVFGLEEGAGGRMSIELETGLTQVSII